MTVQTAWSQRGATSMFVYSDPPSLDDIGIAIHSERFEDELDATVFDRSSRSNALNIGEIAVLKNVQGYFALVKLHDVRNKDRGHGRNEITIEYRILTDRSTDFSACDRPEDSVS